MKNILLFLGILLPGILCAQTVQEDVLHLKNGEVYRGMIMDNQDTARILLKTRSANELLFKKENILRTSTNDVNASFYDNQDNSEEKFAIKKGYSIFSDIGLLMGNDRAGSGQIGFNGELINAYVINPHFSSGIGAASHYYFGDFTFLPVFVNARGNLLKGDFTPFATASYGWSMPWLIDKEEYPLVTKFQGGRFYQVGIGVKNFFRDKVAFFVEVGMASNRLKTTRNQQIGIGRDDLIKEEFIYTKNRITLKIGFQF